MKKRLASTLIVIVVSLVLGLGTEVSAQEIGLKINNHIIKTAVSPIQKFGTTLVPIRVIAENLGATIEWEQAKQTLTIKKEDLEIRLVIGSKTAYINNSVEQLQCAPQLIKGTTVVPIRLISEELGYEVKWQKETNTVIIKGDVDSYNPKNEVAKVTVCEYIGLPETARKDNVFKSGYSTTDYFEIKVEGEIKDLKWIEIDSNKYAELCAEFEPEDFITGVLMEFGKVSNDTLILNTVAVEGIPCQVLVWTWPSGRQGSYDIHYQERDYIITDEE